MKKRITMMLITASILVSFLPTTTHAGTVSMTVYNKVYKHGKTVKKDLNCAMCSKVKKYSIDIRKRIEMVF